MSVIQPPVVKAGMLIRRPVAEVFEAFADPAVTSHFWFTRGSGRLAPGARVRWEWEMYGASGDVIVKAFEPDRRLLLLDDPDGTETEWTFEPRGEERTWVKIENRGFTGTPDEQVAKALDAKGGYELTLAAAKIWLEHGIEPRIVLDHHPDALVEGWKDR